MNQLTRLRYIQDLHGLNDIEAKNTIEKLLEEAIKEEERQAIKTEALKMDLKNIKDRLKSHSEYIGDFAKKVLRESNEIEKIIS